MKFTAANPPLLRFAPARRHLSPVGVAGVAGLFVFGVLYLYLCVTYAIHQREYQYTLGGTRSTPETAAAAGFTEVKIATADGERLDGWWRPPPAAERGVVLFLHGTPGTVPDQVWRLYQLRGLPIPYRWLMKDPFDSEALVGGVTAPLLILHGTDDPAIPVAEAHRLYDAAHEPKMIFIADGAGHLDAWEGGGERLALEALARWTTPAELAR